jgi:uncharacterized membrane protein YoaK (UPF0700 family)
MEKQKNTWIVTLLLSTVAGYCDTATFVAADSIFSAHVTGNFIVFALQIVKGSGAGAWIKLLTFPVFWLAVMIGGRMAERKGKRYFLLVTEGILLLAIGIAAYVFRLWAAVDAKFIMYLLAMIAVLAMGLQNAFGKLFSKETYGPTTVMTGNVTQAALDLGSLFRNGFKEKATLESFRKQGPTIGGFLLGCLLGAIAGKQFGLQSMLLPGILMIVCYLLTPKSTEVNA